METVSSFSDQLITNLTNYVPSLAGGLAVLIIGLWLINRLMPIIEKTLKGSGFGAEVLPFILSLIGGGLKILLVFSAAGILGIETSSFVAVVAALGFAVGMALQGSLSNFAAGVMILLFKPYQMDDLVEIEDHIGYVRSIQIFNTIMETLDQKTIIIPNGQAISGSITNLSKIGSLRVDLQVPMPYQEDFEKVHKIIEGALSQTPKVLAKPTPFIGIETFDSHSIVLAVRPYAQTDDYWDVYFEANRQIKKALSEHNIKVAYSEGVELGDIGQ